jgi:hypothetical protein
MSSSTTSRVVKMFVPRVVALRTLRESKTLCPLSKGGMVEIDLGAIKRLPKKPSPSFQEGRQAAAERIGHICQDWEYDPDEESPSEWCPGCSYLCKKHSEDLFQKSLLEQWLRGGVPLPKPSVADVEAHRRRMAAEQAASWAEWVKTLPSWDHKTLSLGFAAMAALKAGEEGPYALWKEQAMEARILVKTSYYKQEISWCDRLDMSDPGWTTRITVPEPRPVVVPVTRPAASASASQWRPLRAIAEESAAPAAGSESASAGSVGATRSSELFGGASAQQWLRSQDRRPSEAKEREVEQWLAVKKNMRPIYTGAAPLRGVAQADTSSLLVTGFGPEVGLWELRRLAALAGPVRDVYRPRSGNTVFVEMLEAGGAQKAKALFAANPVEMGTRRLVFDVAQRNNTERYSRR